MAGNSDTSEPLRARATLKIGLAALLWSLCWFLTGDFWSSRPPLSILLFWSIVPWFSGLSDLARAKGYSSWRALAGMLHVVGLVYLIILPERQAKMLTEHNQA